MKNKLYGMVVLVLGVMAGVLSQAAAADETANKVEALSQKVSELERKMQNADASTNQTTKFSGHAMAGKDGFLLLSSDEAFQMRIRGYMQADARIYLNDSQNTASDNFLLRRVRPIFDVKMYNDYTFCFQPDFGGSSPTIQDAYFDYAALSALKLRAGKFKVPFGLEYLQTDSERPFAENGLPSQLVPNRDVGFQAYGGVASGAVTYAVGVFNGTTDAGNSDSDNNDQKDLVARLFLSPFRFCDFDNLQNVGIGMAGTFGSQQGTSTSPSLPSFKTSGQQTFFSYKSSTNANGTAFADGHHLRLGPQAYCYVGPFAFLAEYFKSSQDVSNGRNAATLDNTAWQVELGWVLTGENASFTDVKPRTSFAPSKGQWGALELVGRYGALNIDDAAFSLFADPTKSATGAKEWAVGLNWYLNRSIKLMVDYDVTSFDGGAAKGANRPNEDLLVARAQFSF